MEQLLIVRRSIYSGIYIIFLLLKSLILVILFSYGIVLIEIITRKNIARDLPRSSAANYGVDVELLRVCLIINIFIYFIDSISRSQVFTLFRSNILHMTVPQLY